MMRKAACWSCAVAVCFGSVLRAGPIPAPPEGAEVFPEFRLADTAEARALFSPMTGSLPVSLERAGQGAYVRLPVNFEGTDHERASWDIGITVDLAVARGVQFDFFCADSSPISGFVLYFRSGGGWYRANFAPERDGQWQRIVVDKSTTGTEGSPGGWGAVDTIRLSAWRGANRDTVCAIANLGPVGADADILVVRADSCAASGNRESRGYSQYAEHVATCLADAGLDHALLSDLDVTAARLAGRKLVMLPYNPKLPEGLLPLLEAFVQDGGRVISFYSLPEGLADLIGVKRGTWAPVGEGKHHYQGFARTSQGLDGQPAFVGQGSWCSLPAEPIAGKSRTVAVWRGPDGVDTDVPAIVVSERGGYVGHVWLKDDWGNKKSLMLALVGGIVPGVWEKAARAELANIGRFGSYSGFDALRQELGAQALPRRRACERKRLHWSATASGPRPLLAPKMPARPRSGPGAGRGGPSPGSTVHSGATVRSACAARRGTRRSRSWRSADSPRFCPTCCGAARLTTTARSCP